MKIDLVGVIEAAYEPQDSGRAWLARVMEALRPLLERDGGGVGAFEFDVRARRAPDIATAVMEVPGLDESAPGTLNGEASPETVARLYSGAVASSLSSRGAHVAPEFMRALGPLGFVDMVSIRVDDAEGSGCIVCAPRRSLTRVSAAEAVLYERLAAHFAAGRRLLGVASTSSEADAIVAPSGKVEHATGTARDVDSREALGASARRIEKARGRLRRVAPEEAVAEWRALVDGRWSLVETFDHDGRRYFVARKNPTSRRTLRPLTKRESEVTELAARGHSNKLIAYELGLNISSVAGHLASAARRLGVPSRVQLIARWSLRKREPVV